MTRVKSARVKRARHKKILKLAKGYRGARGRLARPAKEAVMHAGSYAFAGRRQRKRQKREEWITTINAALKESNVAYNQFVKNLQKKDIQLDRKILSEIIKKDKPTFDAIVKEASK